MTPSRPVTQQTVSIIGYGNIGSWVAGLLSGFNVEILAHDPHIHEIDTHITDADPVSLETVLTKSDVVFVTAELTDKIRSMIPLADRLSTKTRSLRRYVRKNRRHGP